MKPNKNIDDQIYYFVYKLSDERHGGIDDFYGWSTNKSIVNAFLKQRNKKNYIVEKIIIDADQSSAYSKRGLVDMRYMDLQSNLMIDMLPLKSCQSGEIIKFFTTEDEKIRILNNIDSMFNELRSFERVDDESIAHLVNIYTALQTKYTDALECIGYRPMEVSYLFDGTEDIYNDVNYGLNYSNPDDIYDKSIDQYKLDISKTIVYSLEAVIKVLKDEL